MALEAVRYMYTRCTVCKSVSVDIGAGFERDAGGGSGGGGERQGGFLGFFLSGFSS